MGSTFIASAVVERTLSVPLGSTASALTYSTAARGRNRASTRWRIRAALSIWLLQPDRSLVSCTGNATDPAAPCHLPRGHTFAAAYAQRHTHTADVIWSNGRSGDGSASDGAAEAQAAVSIAISNGRLRWAVVAAGTALLCGVSAVVAAWPVPASALSAA